MQDLKLTLVQADQIWENKSANLANYERLLSSVEKSDIILLPEMFHTGFSMNAVDLAEEMDASEGLNWLKEQASKHQSAIYTSLIISDGDHFRNRGVFVKPDGRITIYDKRRSFGLAGENEVYTQGEERVVVEYRGWKILLQICYDLRFPELSRNRMDDKGQAEYDLLLYVANWPERRSEHWKTLLRARAIENQCYVAGVNRVGTDGKSLVYSGDTVLIDPLGMEKGTSPHQEEVFSVEINYELLEKVREQLPFLKDM
jgi:omega-amidase